MDWNELWGVGRVEEGTSSKQTELLLLKWEKKIKLNG